jgi:hypothetical protein
MTFQFSPDFKYLYTKHDDGSVSGTPTDQLTEEDKQFIYEQKAKEGYA